MDKIEKSKSSKNNKQDTTVDTKNSKEQNDILHDNNISIGNDNVSKDTSISTNDNITDQVINPNDFSLDLAVLNEIGKAAKMAMSSINYLSPYVTNHELKKTIVAIYSQYSNILHQVSQHFEKYGEIPDDATVTSRIMSFLGTKVNTKFDHSSSHITEIMIEGTIMGIIKCIKISNKNLKITEETKNLLNDFTQFQKENILKLDKYL